MVVCGELALATAGRGFTELTADIVGRVRASDVGHGRVRPTPSTPVPRSC